MEKKYEEFVKKLKEKIKKKIKAEYIDLADDAINEGIEAL